MTMHTSRQISPRTLVTGLACLLLALHGVWYLGVWPGPIGQDGYSLLSNINEGGAKYTGKDPAWLLYAMGTYGLTQRAEALVIPLVLAHVFIFTRIIGWAFLNGHRKTAIFSLIFIACAPHVLNYETSLYPDSIFSLAFIAVLFEVWICLKKQRADAFSIMILAVFFPMAAFFKGNGILIIVPFLYLAFRLKGFDRWLLLAICIFWWLFVHAGGKIHDLGNGHGAMKPLILFETVNFMQTKPMGLHENRQMVTDETKRIVHAHISQEDIDRLFDRDYWDTLWHMNHDRVRFKQMSKENFRKLRHEFFAYNLWRNIPAFVSSRVNIFLASAFAQGGMVAPMNGRENIGAIPTQSKPSPIQSAKIQKQITKLYNSSYKRRFLLWSPILGVFLIVYCAWLAIQRKNLDEVVICFTLLAELGGIFVFSIAAEYRYLLMIFFCPMLLLPLLQTQRHERVVTPPRIQPNLKALSPASAPLR